VTLTVPRASEPELDRFRTRAAAGELYATLLGKVVDGTVCLLDGRFTPPV
jgi:hypothetical protein